jgi:hypothetical protein
VPYQYTAYGLGLRSAFPLPELVTSGGNADAEVRKEGLASVAPKKFRGDRHFATEGGRVVLAWRGYATIHVRAGSEILVDPADRVEPGWLRQCILGPAIGTLLHQRGLLVLHGSAVEIGGEAVAFIGHKGAGKSTTAAALHQRGHPLLSDDLLVLDLRHPGSPSVLPGPRQVKLWPDAAEALSADPSALEPFHTQVPKRIWRLGEKDHHGPLPLRRIYSLLPAEEVRFARTSRRDAFRSVMQYLYATRFTGSMGMTGAHLEMCTRLARVVPVVNVSRPLSLSRLPQMIRGIERDAERPFSRATA